MSISQVTIDQMVQQMSTVYCTLINKKLPLHTVPSIMLWGPPGVGKSQGVRQVAEEIERLTGKKVAVTDVRLLLFNPVDLRGIPTANADRTLAVWLKPQIFQMDASPDIVNILFLDEISSAPQSVQAAAYQITLDHTIGEHKLPDNCIVFAAGNRVTDRSVAYNMPKALANRLCHFEIKGDSRSWHDWAIRTGIHPYVVGYLQYNTGALMRFDGDAADLAFATPRSWEMVSNLLNSVTSSIEEIYPMIIGCVGEASAARLKTWAELYEGLPDMEEIFNGRCKTFPTEPEFQAALRSQMVGYARKHPVKRLIDCSIDYSCKLPWAFRGQLLHDYYQVPELREILETNEVFCTAVSNGMKL